MHEESGTTSAALRGSANIQHLLSEFLELELHHSLGAYRRTTDRLRDLGRRLEENHRPGSPEPKAFLPELVGIMRDYNARLDATRDAATPTSRHPTPAVLPLSRATRFTVPDTGHYDVTYKQSLTWLCAFYDAVIYTLGESEATRQGRDDPPHVGAFRSALLMRRAEAHRAHQEQNDHRASRRANRLRRFEDRRASAIESGIPGTSFATRPATTNGAGGELSSAVDTVDTIVNSHLGDAHRRPLAAFTVRALVDAHLVLHEVEAHRAVPLGESLTRGQETRRREERVLRRAIALSTFAWAASRTAPWMFAENDVERGYMLGAYERVWRNNMPVRAMWISTQVALLALHRRGCAYALLGDKTSAFKDFLKVQREVRETARRLEGGAVLVRGATDFLNALEALADQHIGELYRRDRDHTSALRHYKRAYRGLAQLRRQEGDAVLINARWYVKLQLGLGKAAYELGQHKAALAWHLRAWRSLLELVATDSGAEVRADALDEALMWLDRIVDDPEVHKRDVVYYLRPIVDQIDAFRVDHRVKALASEIVLRLGHLLFVLNLDEQRFEDPARDPRGLGAAPGDRGLALMCVRRAWQLDRRGLAIADLLKLDFRASRLSAPPKPITLARSLEREPFPVEEMWTGGATEVERLSRAIEYVLLQELRNAGAASSTEARLGRELLHSLLTHTESIEARRSQVHEHLVRPAGRDVGERGEPAIEFECLRRYSSAFPLLPRPREFHSHGGGYFARVHVGDPDHAIGIAIDPGTSYVETLYRAGYGIADVDVMVITHDHVDHASSFEPFLALRYEASQVAPELQERKLWILGNASVLARWKRFGRYDNDSLRFVALENPKAVARVARKLNRRLAVPADPQHGTPEREARLRLTPLPSTLDGTGHTDIGLNPSFGLLLELEIPETGERCSLALTSDLPEIPKDVRWTAAWRAALSADMLVAHVSTAPLSELRQMAALGKPAKGSPLAHDVRWMRDQWRRLAVQDPLPETAARIQYAYWLEGRQKARVGPVGHQGFDQWQIHATHPYVGGLLRLAEAFRDARTEPGRLFVIGELSEELGSFRGKIAVQLNGGVLGRPTKREKGAKRREKAEKLAQAAAPRAVTADIGMRARVRPSRATSVRVRCSTCDLDNDLAPQERYHLPQDIFELCVKGENEGTFYNCRDHEPAGQPTDPTFVERLERYDVFGR